MSRLSRLALLAIAALALALPAAAQSTSNLDDLRGALHLSADQQDAWRDFVAASSQDAAREARERSAEDMLPTLPAPRRVDLSIAVARAELDALERRGAAVKAFYAVLSPEQKATFDRETAPRDR